MKLEIINNIRVLSPSDGKLLCNTTDMVLSDKVYLGVNADETTWTEIEESEREVFEMLWLKELELNKSNANNYTEADEILLGVN